MVEWRCMKKVKRTSHALYDLWYHIAWSTKYRKKVLKGKVKERAKALFQIIAAHHDSEISNLQILEDHLHLLISVPPRIAPAKIVQVLKSYSTHVLFREFPELRNQYWGGELWIAGYFVRSVGPGLTKEAIQRYISSQEQF
jgi:putative transposase